LSEKILKSQWVAVIANVHE